MSHRPRPLPAAALAVVLVALSVALAAADEPLAERSIVGDGEHRAGLVVDDGEEMRSVCLLFEEETITGEDLLERSGLEFEMAHYGTLGAAVCAIGDVGCPAEDCHCAASYWSYWLHDDEADDGWRTAPIGASSREIRDGDLDARVWGDGQRRPPRVDLDMVCDPDGADTAAPLPGGGEPDEPPTETADRPLATGDSTDLVWFAVALSIIGTAIWWRRRRRLG